MGQQSHSIRTGLGGFSSAPVEMFVLDAEAWLLDTVSQTFDMTAPTHLYSVASPDIGAPPLGNVLAAGQTQPTKVGGVRISAIAGGTDTIFRVHAVSSVAVAAVGYVAATEAAKGIRYAVPAGEFWSEEFAIGAGYTLLIEIISGGFVANGLEVHWMLS